MTRGSDEVWPFPVEERPVFKLIVPLLVVPNGATVTKRTGKKEYKVSRCIRIFADENGKSRTITPDTGVVFLCSGNSDFDAVVETMEVVWSANADQVIDLVDPPEIPQ